jgi:hypothetical protein
VFPLGMYTWRRQPDGPLMVGEEGAREPQQAQAGQHQQPEVGHDITGEQDVGDRRHAVRCAAIDTMPVAITMAK